MMSEELEAINERWDIAVVRWGVFFVSLAWSVHYQLYFQC